MKKRILVLAVACLVSASAAHAGPRPNIIIIGVDAMRPDHMSMNGYPRRTTPNIDRIAKQGVSFDAAYTLIPLTNPSITTLFTSRSPYETGVNRNGIPLPKHAETMMDILEANGYTTAGVAGCWALQHKRSGLGRHFDYFLDSGLELSLELSAKTMTERAQKLIATKLKPPFMLWLHYPDPHQPHRAQRGFDFSHDEMAGNKAADNYDSEIASADHWIGVLLDDLRGRGMLDDAIVVIMADHGENLAGEKDIPGHGRRLYQTIVKIPLIISGPAIPHGERVPTQVQIVDIAPTVLAYAGLEPGRQMQGRNLLPIVYAGIGPPPKPLFFETYSVAVIDVPGFKWLGRKASPTAIGMKVGDFKIVYYFDKKEWELYNLADDPDENENLYDPDDPFARDLDHKLRDWYIARNRREKTLPGMATVRK